MLRSKAEDVTPIVENVTSIVENVTSIPIADVIDPENITQLRENVTPVTSIDDEELKKKKIK